MRYPFSIRIILLLSGFCFLLLTSFNNFDNNFNDKVLLNMSNVFVNKKNKAVFKLNLNTGDILQLNKLQKYSDSSKKSGSISEVDFVLVPANNPKQSQKVIHGKAVQVNATGVHELVITTRGTKGIQIDFRMIMLNALPKEAGETYTAFKANKIFVGLMDVFNNRAKISEYGRDEYMGKFPSVKVSLDAGDVLVFNSNDQRGLSNLKYHIKQLAEEGMVQGMQPIKIDQKDTYEIIFFIDIDKIEEKGFMGIKGKKQIAEMRSLRSFSDLSVRVTKAKDLAVVNEEETEEDPFLKALEKSNAGMEEWMKGNTRAQGGMLNAMKEQFDKSDEQMEMFLENFFKVKKVPVVTASLGGEVEMDLSPVRALNVEENCQCKKVNWDKEYAIYIAWLGVGKNMHDLYKQKEKENKTFANSVTGNGTIQDFVREAILAEYENGDFKKLVARIKDYYPNPSLNEYTEHFSEMVEFALVNSENKELFLKNKPYRPYSNIADTGAFSLSVSNATEDDVHFCARNHNLNIPINLLFKFNNFTITEQEVSAYGLGTIY